VERWSHPSPIFRSKSEDSSIVILKALPVRQCRQCGDIELEHETMARVDHVLAGAGPSSELQVIRFADTRNKSARSSLEMTMKIDCAFCNGWGRPAGTFEPICPICEGQGKLVIAGNPELHKCNFCNGWGRKASTL
jgi:RecJ-like exonuclease